MSVSITGKHFPSFGPEVPDDTVAEVVAPIINEWIAMFNSGQFSDGTEAFQCHVLSEIAKARLGEDQWVPIWRVIVHPDNREGGVLVPIDVHDLLRILNHNGWNWARVDACACEIPSVHRKMWLDRYLEVINQSDGLLPKPPAMHHVSIATARGSHTTSACQVLDAVEKCKGIYPELCGPDGLISKSKIWENQVSLQQPLDKGLKYFVISWKLVVRSPSLMSTLSRTGNVVHDTYRHATPLQQCIRLHEVLVKDPSKSDNDIVTQAGRGLSMTFNDIGKVLLPFVRKLSGGTDAYTLISLEEYERQLTVKRNIHPADFKQKSIIDPLGLERFVVAMVKAELNAPVNFVDSLGYSTLFPATGSECANLGRLAELRLNAKTANTWMLNASSFLDAYGDLEQTVYIKLISDFEVSLVMHVFNKRSDTRKHFRSMEDIAAGFYGSVRDVKPNIPQWSRIKAIPASSGAPASASGAGLRELHASGEIDISELQGRGFAIDSKVQGPAKERNIYNIESLKDNVCVLVRVGDAREETLISFADLIGKYVPYVPVEKQTFEHDSYPSPVSLKDHLVPLWNGLIRVGLHHMFLKSSEDAHGVLIHKLPRPMVTAAKAYKVGQLKLVGISSSVSITKLKDVTANSLVVAECFTHDESTYVAVVSKKVVYPSEGRSGTLSKVAVPYLAAYWHCEESFDENKVNADREMVDYTFKAGGIDVNMRIPMIVNTKAIKEGVSVVLPKIGVDAGQNKRKLEDIDVDNKESDAKAPKAKGKGSKQGKAKGRGKGK
jgi:hypothetical protein